MPCFNPSQAHSIKQNMDVLARRLWNVSAKPLTYEDFLALFVPSDLRDDYRRVAKHARSGGGRAYFTWPGNEKHVAFHLRHDPNTGRFPPPIPRELRLQEDAPSALIEDIHTWSERSADVSRDVGRIYAAFDRLNESLTRGQMRSVWPSIIAILNVNPHDTRLVRIAKEMQAMRASATSDVVIPHGVIQACRKTAATIATMSIIPTDIQMGEPHKLTEVVLVGQDGRNHEEPDLAFGGATF